MAHFDLDSLSLRELKQLQHDVEKSMADFVDRQRAAAKAALEAKAKEMGFTLADLVGGDVKKGRAPVEAKYRHPGNPSLTWSGRGRKPQWFLDAVAAGTTPESLAI